MIKKIIYFGARLLNRRPVAIKNSIIDKKASIGNGTQIVDCKVGKYSYIFDSSVINTEVGNFCSIAMGCTIGGRTHPLNWVSTSPIFYSGKNCLRKNFSNNTYFEYRRTIIGNDVWIGSNCLIKGGITIGDGAVVGMGSVVTHDVPPYEIWAGNPAKCIRKRFDDKTIKQLLDIQWWNFSDDKLKEIGMLFNDTESFIDYMENSIK